MIEKTQKEIIETVNCEYYFTQDELRELGADPARTLSKADSLRADLKTQKDEFTSKIGLEEARAQCFQNNINTRREIRATRCRVIFRPKDATKDFFNFVTGKLEKSEAMSSSDYEMNLFEDAVAVEPPLNPVIDESRQIVDAEIVLPPHSHDADVPAQP